MGSRHARSPASSAPPRERISGENFSSGRNHGGGGGDADRHQRGGIVGRSRGARLGGAHDHALRSGAVPQPHRSGDPGFSPAGPSRRQAREAARPVLTASRCERALRARGRRDRAGAGGRGPGRRDDGLRVGRRRIRRVADPVVPRRGAARAPSLALAVFCGAASCNIAIEFGFTGPNATNAMSCASGTIAVGEAFHVVRDGRADVMLAGGAEAPLSPMTFAAFSVIRAMSTRNDDPAHAPRPVDASRDGLVMRGGAAGAKTSAGVVGQQYPNDAYHMTAPRPDGRQAARAIRLALADGDVALDEVGYINAHGSSTPLNDSTETSAIKQVFGDHAYRLTVSGTKGYYGHALGAGGAIEAAICALALSRGWLPPTVNLERPDPKCDLDCLPGSPAGGGRAASPRAVGSNSFGFGGINAALVLRPDGNGR